jgi:phospholipid-binding lipoprotein MlaA
VGALSGCATPPPASDADALAEYNETNDPFEPANRKIYAFNDNLDTYLIRPLAVAYRAAIPQVVRSHTHNVLANLGMPVQLFNDMFEAKPRRAGDSLMRFVVNSTLGVGGIFEVATDLGYPDHDSDGATTLAIYGFSSGPYLYLPVFGPSSPRDGIGMGLDALVNPFTWVGHGNVDKYLGYARFGIGALDTRANLLDDLDKITSQALDPYATIRSLYRQHRESQIEDTRQYDEHTIPAWFPAEMRKPHRPSSAEGVQKQ